MAKQPEHLEVGNTLHELFDEYNKSHAISDIVNILSKEPVYAKNIAGFHKILKHYNVDRAVESESKYFDETLQLTGYIDAIYELNDETIDTIKHELREEKYKFPTGKLAVIDYKTGKYHNYLFRKYIKELNIYVMLYEACTEKKIDYIGMFFTSEPENSFIVPVKKRLLNNDAKDFEKQKQNVLEHKFQRKHTKLCAYCDYNAICDDYIDEYVTEDKKKIYS